MPLSFLNLSVFTTSIKRIHKKIVSDVKDGSDIATTKEHTKVEDIVRESEPGALIPGRLEITTLSGGISCLHS